MKINITEELILSTMTQQHIRKNPGTHNYLKYKEEDTIKKKGDFSLVPLTVTAPITTVGLTKANLPEMLLLPGSVITPLTPGVLKKISVMTERKVDSEFVVYYVSIGFIGEKNEQDKIKGFDVERDFLVCLPQEPSHNAQLMVPLYLMEVEGTHLFNTSQFSLESLGY